MVKQKVSKHRQLKSRRVDKESGQTYWYTKPKSRRIMITALDKLITKRKAEIKRLQERQKIIKLKRKIWKK